MVVLNLRCCHEALTETTNVPRGDRSMGRYFDPTTPEYEPAELLRLCRSVCRQCKHRHRSWNWEGHRNLNSTCHLIRMCSLISRLNEKNIYWECVCGQRNKENVYAWDDNRIKLEMSSYTLLVSESFCYACVKVTFHSIKYFQRLSLIITDF